MGMGARSSEYLINRARYLNEKLKAYEIMIQAIRKLQLENKDSMAFVEASEAVIKVIESQMKGVALSLKVVEEELSKREVALKKQ